MAKFPCAEMDRFVAAGHSLSMPKHSSKKKPADQDLQQIARRVLDEVVPDSEPPKKRAAKKKAEPKKNPAAVALGRLGGLKGGKARAEKLTPEQRKEIARKAAQKRWSRWGEAR